MGKSTLARSYAEAVDQLVIQYCFTDHNYDITSVCQGIAQEFADNPAMRSFVVPARTGNPARDINELFHVIARHHAAPKLIYIDNYHLLPEGDVLHGILASLVPLAEELSFTFVIAGRTFPTAPWSTAVANRHIEVLSDFSYDPEELSAVIATYPDVPAYDDDWVLEVHYNLAGWPAGVTLLLERLRLGLDESLTIEDLCREATSGYLQDKLFGLLAEDTRQVLLRASLLPFLPADGADTILDRADTQKIFSQLCNERLFTTRQLRRAETPPEDSASYSAYQLSQPFRTFLFHRALQELPTAEITSVVMRGAENMVFLGEVSAAAQLYTEHDRWNDAVLLLLNSALPMIQSGQVEQLNAIFSLLPTGVLNGDPNLLFWKGVCDTSLGNKGAREQLSQAYSLYSAQENYVGMALAWRGLVDAIWISWDGLDELGPWISEYETRAAVEYKTLPQSVQDLLSLSRFGVLSFWAPDHPELPTLEHWVGEHVHTPMLGQEKMLLFVKMLYHFTYGTGNRVQTDFFLNVMRTWVQQESSTPLDKILLHNFEAAYHYCFDGTPDRCYAFVESALEMCEDSGVSVWKSVSLTHGLYMALGQGDITRAKHYFSLFKQAIGLNNAMHVAFDEFFSGWLALLEGRSGSSVKHIEAGLNLLERSPVPMIRSLFLGARAALFVQQRDWRPAWAALRELRFYARSARSNTFEMMARLLQAEWCLQRRRYWAARAFLQRARDIGVAQNMFVCPWIVPDQLSGLIGFALACDIDKDYFSRWVSLYSLKVPADFTARDRWPWRIKIRTLGALEVRLDDELQESKGRAHKKLLQILGVLINAGAMGEEQAVLINELWPDKGEHKGRSNLNTNLARLRTFLGEVDAIISSEGRVYLNEAVCWIDSWELLRTEETHRAPGIEQLSNLESIYKGEYRVSSAEGSSEIILRGTLRNRYITISRALGRALEEKSDYPRAIVAYRNMLDKLGAEEVVYRDLMHCYAKMNRVQDIVSTYTECQQVLMKWQGVEPSRETNRYYELLLADM
jgi:DNA-binding SARP family transcriptional activator